MPIKIRTGLGVSLLLVLLSLCLGTPAKADIGWLQKGVRVWYFGGIEGGGGPSSNAEEAYLINGIDGNQVNLIHHSALEYWTAPRPVETATYPLLDKGPCWIHPQVLQNLQIGDTWMGNEITFVERKTYTYNTFPYHLLPAWALFKLTPQRLLVKISYMIPYFSTGNAYFDAETGLLLYYHTLWAGHKMFLILSEINFHFQTGRAFPEDGGPHTGFKSIASEQSSTFGGSVVIQSLVETRYGYTIEMTVSTSLLGSTMINKTENYCFFGDVPSVRYKDFTQAGNLPPEDWDPYGQYLWWWIPPGALAGTSIDVLGVPLTRITAGAPADPPPLTAAPQHFTASSNPPAFHFSSLWFGENGYLTLFSAKDPSIGLDVREDQIFLNNNSVIGLNYYGNTMGTAIPVTTPAMFLPLIERH